MNLYTKIRDKDYQLDIANPISIGIPVKFNGEQPNHFGAAIASKKTLEGGGFVGDTKRGGSCNVDQISMVPHCNGTHTESVQHITNQPVPIGAIHNNSISHCLLISVTPKAANETVDSYIPALEEKDYLIDLASLKTQISEADLATIQALVIRTLPNQNHKLSVIYCDQTQPPFFSQEAMQWLANSPIKHLLVDFPSLDKMYDDGHLSNHHTYWNLTADSHQLTSESIVDRTVTEMVYVPDTAKNGFYALNLQYPAFELDAAPSRPLLYPLIELTQED